MLLRPPIPPAFRLRYNGGVRAATSRVSGCCNVGCVRAGTAGAARSGARTVPEAVGSTPSAVIVMPKEIVYSVGARSGPVLIVRRCLYINRRFAVDFPTSNAAVFCCRQHSERVPCAIVSVCR